MSQGIAKSAEVPVEKRAPVKHEVGITAGVQSHAPINMEFFRYFNLNPAMDSGNDNLKYIAEWSINNSKDLGHALKNIKNTEIKLGAPSSGETRISKLYNYLRMTNRLTDKKMEMDNELASITGKRKAMVAELKEMYDGKIGKINEEFDRIKGDYLKAKAMYNRDASARSMALRNEFLSQLKELEAMRDAYKGSAK